MTTPLLRLRVRSFFFLAIATLFATQIWQNKQQNLSGVFSERWNHDDLDIGFPRLAASKACSFTAQNRSNLFHLVHTTDRDSFVPNFHRSIESIFYHHPQAEVILHSQHLTQQPFEYLRNSCFNIKVESYDPREELRRLLDYKEFDHPLVTNFIEKIKDYKDDTSGFWYSNESNLMRMILMYLEGGIYVDTDVILTRSMESLPLNFLGRQDEKTVNGAIMSFEPHNTFIRDCLIHFLETFNNRAWGWNGPGLLTRVLDKAVGEPDVRVLNSQLFYFFHYKYIVKDCYEDAREEKVAKRLARIQKNSYAVHLNNHLNGSVANGTVCSCLLNSFCVGGTCDQAPVCQALFQSSSEITSDFKVLSRQEYEDTNGVTLHKATTTTELPFHLIHTTDDSTFGLQQKRSVESIFHHHPNTTVMLHVKEMTVEPVQYLIDAGYDLRLRQYDSASSLRELRDQGIIKRSIADDFISKLDDFAKGTEGNWFSNESNLLRMIFLFLEGGIYIDTDVIVVNPVYDLPDNVFGYQDADQTRLNGAMMKFTPGHSYIRACLNDFFRRFNNRRWGANGPRLLTRVYQQGDWPDVSIFENTAFQYFDWRYIEHDCYQDTRDHKVLKRLEGIHEQSYVVHLNNHVGANTSEGSVCYCLLRLFCAPGECQGDSSVERCQKLYYS